MMYSEINRLKEDFHNGKWGKFITKLVIDGIHGFKKKEIKFEYPFIAIAGENGTGKSTILKALACAYKGRIINYSAGRLFPKTKWDSDNLAEIKYCFNLGGKERKFTISKSATRWRSEKRILGNTIFLDVNRIRSIESLRGYAKFTRKKIKETNKRELKIGTTQDLAEILAREYSSAKFVTTNIDSQKELGVLTLPFAEISQFHQGTGESITLDLLSELEKIPKNSLVLIDEIESSLHPRAQRKLVRKLLKVVRERNLQLVFTTHSEYILDEVPQNFRILLKKISDESIEVFYNPSTEFCLTNMDDYIHEEIVIVVEDEKSLIVLREIIRNYSPELLTRIKLIPLGQENLVETMEKLYLNKKIPIKILGIVDADSTKNITKLPGNLPPERQIFGSIIRNDLADLIPKSLVNKDPKEVKKDIIHSTLITNHHLWVKDLARKWVLDESTLWILLVGIWIRSCLKEDEMKGVIDAIKKRISDGN